MVPPWVRRGVWEGACRGPGPEEQPRGPGGQTQGAGAHSRGPSGWGLSAGCRVWDPWTPRPGHHVLPSREGGPGPSGEGLAPVTWPWEGPGWDPLGPGCPGPRHWGCFQRPLARGGRLPLCPLRARAPAPLLPELKSSPPFCSACRGGGWDSSGDDSGPPGAWPPPPPPGTGASSPDTCSCKSAVCISFPLRPHLPGAPPTPSTQCRPRPPGA